MLSDLEKAYNYLQFNNLIGAFIANCQSADSNFKSMQIATHSSFIRRAFEWHSSPEGQAFWDDHDEAILRLYIRLSAKDVLDYIESQQQTPKSYEYW